MMKYTFTPQTKQPRYASYRLDDLRRMTLLQLRDVCEQEQIICAALDKLDRDALIDVIMKFRGSRERLLLNSYNPERMEYLQNELRRAKLIELPLGNLRAPAKISLFDGLDTGFFDGYRVTYLPELDGVNAFVADRELGICAALRVLSFAGHEELLITRLSEFPCHEADARDYRLLLFPQRLSDNITRVYDGALSKLPDEIEAYVVPLLAFEVRIPEESDMPLAIDFGTSNTAAGVFLSNAAFGKIQGHIQPGILNANAVNYLRFLTPEGAEAPVLPTVIGVERIDGDDILYNCGFDAEAMTDSGYFGQGICVFYDIKRWAADYDEAETLSDGGGGQKVVPRKHIIRAYIRHIIHSAEQRFKCRFKKLFLSYPVKQRERFISLYRDIFADYDILESEMFDEGIAVLYGVVGTLIDEKKYRDGETLRALIMDCGGGTTDQSSASFAIRRGSVAYEIDIETSYENGDTDFGGNNLTFRIMQLLKIGAASQIAGNGKSLSEVTAGFSSGRYIQGGEDGKEEAYRELERLYGEAEAVIPTRYREYEFGSGGRDEYYKARNNFHYLFTLAERVKKSFFENEQILRISISSEDETPQPDTLHIKARRRTLSARKNGALEVINQFPAMSLNAHQVRAVFRIDIQDIFRRFVGRLYDDGQLDMYNIVKLTGQSCKIGLFRESLMEYVPGVKIQRRQSGGPAGYRLKLTCLDGAIRYLRDNRLGLARVNIRYGSPALPYILSAHTHDGEKITLIESLDRDKVQGAVSRNMASVEVELTLSDARGAEKFTYSVTCDPNSFREATYERIEAEYGEHIPQSDVDTIENGEVRYFVWADAGQWGFSVVPVLRRDEGLRVGDRQLLSFENDSWMVNYFDGMH
ncbi:MAG: hypothetical protein LBD49_01030 [Oscillospiraceae bacterium]|jgi:hypothetical protein|nr:hypothetical protein [Oscillospiraceae bacterium]